MKIAVIGAGPAGRQFAADCAVSGLEVCLEDVMPSRLRSAEATFASLARQVRLVTTIEDAVADADLVVDFVPDELESKLEIFSMLDRMSPPRTVLCTPSETLSITDLASCTYRSDRCVMVRGLSTGLRPLRLLITTATSQASLQTVQALFHSLNVAALPEADPDLPMLMKNMGDTALGRISPAEREP